jgi:Predicted membrane protein
MTLKLKHLSFVGLLTTLALFMSAGVGLKAKALDINTHETSQIVVQENLQYGLGVSPGKLRDLTLLPGQTYEGIYKIYNEGQNDISIVIGISPFSYSADYKNVDLIRSSSFNQIQEWVEIDKDPIDLKSGELKNIPFKINVPEDARGGGQYFAFINRINPGSEPDEKGGMVSGVKQIGLTVGTKIEAEDLNACAKVTNQHAAFWQIKAPLETKASVENCGNIDFTAHGKIKIENALFGGGVAYETSDDEKVEIQVFPNNESTIRDVEINWDNAPEIGLFKVTQEISIGDKTETITKTVLMLPIWVIIVAIIVITMILLAIVIEKISKRKRQNRNKII